MLLVLWLPLIMSVYVCRQEADGTLDCISMALTCTFNRWGTLLAVGCNDGRIVIWDFLTRGIAKIISAHIHPVCSLWWDALYRKTLNKLLSVVRARHEQELTPFFLLINEMLHICVCAVGVEMATSWWVPPRITLCRSGTSWLETATRGSASPRPSSNCSTTPETCEWPDSIWLCTLHQKCRMI